MKSYNNLYKHLLSIIKYLHGFLYLILTKPKLTHCKENPIYVFLFWALRGLHPNFHIRVSLSDLYIPRISAHI
jgi:hypothetical protein